MGICDHSQEGKVQGKVHVSTIHAVESHPAVVQWDFQGPPIMVPLSHIPIPLQSRIPKDMGIVSPIIGGSLESPLICGIFVGFVGPWGKKGSSLECILGYMGLPKTDLWMSILDQVVGGRLFSTRYGVGFGRWFVLVKEKGHFASPTNHLEHVTTWTEEFSFQPKEEWEILGQDFGMSLKYHLDFFVWIYMRSVNLHHYVFIAMKPVGGCGKSKFSVEHRWVGGFGSVCHEDFEDYTPED